MKISIVASSVDEKTLEQLFADESVTAENVNEKLGEIRKHSFDVFSGKAGGICYMPSSWDKLNNEPEEKSLKRSSLTKENGHHSTQAHDHISLVIEDCPKILAMFLNNEHEYVTSEKSARYTLMSLEEPTLSLFNKWNNTYKEILDKTHPELNERRRTKQALENGRCDFINFVCLGSYSLVSTSLVSLKTSDLLSSLI